MAQIAVVIKADDSFGNLAMPGKPLRIVTALGDETNGYKEQTKELDIIGMLGIRQQVFEVGEIILLDGGTGRELGYPGRNPSKFEVELKYVDSLDEAVTLSNKAMSEWMREQNEE